MELFVSFFTNFLANINILQHSSFNYRCQSETFNWSNVKLNLIGNLVPMSLFHAFLSKCNSQRYIWLKLIDVLLHGFSNLKDLWVLLISEVSQDRGNSLVRGIKGVIKLNSIQILPSIMQPTVMRFEPVSCGKP
jgi:hypothetical protein